MENETGVIILLTCNRKRSFRKTGVALKRAVFWGFFWFFYFFWIFSKSFLFSMGLHFFFSSLFLLFLLFLYSCPSSSSSSSSSPSSSPSSSSQGHVTYSGRESHRHFQTIDTRAPLIGSTIKTKQKSVKISLFLIT